MKTLLSLSALISTSIIITACGGSVSTGSKSVSQAEAETQAKASLAQEFGVPASEVPPIKCPGELKAEVGTKMVCDFGPVEGQMGTATLTVTSVNGSDVKFKVTTAANNQ